MRTILLMLRKEFLQIARNKAMLPVIFLAPLVQLVILSNAASFEIKHIRMHIVDLDRSYYSRLLIDKYKSTNYFEVINYSFSEKIANKDLYSNNVDLILEIPAHFERDLVKEKNSKVQFIINAIDGQAAGLTDAYATSILVSYNQELQPKLLNPMPPGVAAPALINVSPSYWFNPQLDYKTFMVPGILVLLVTMVCLFLTSMNIVREKELGTSEQLNVSPIRKREFIIGKLLPFWFIGLFELALGLTLGKLVFDIPMVGNVLYIFLFASVYMLAVLGIGLLISTFKETQQQAIFVSWFFMVIFMLMSGLFTPIESMPDWAQKITLGNPVAYFIRVIRMVLLKGAGFQEIKRYILYMIGFAIVTNSLAVWNYRKRA